jgi:hypothetical protein
LSDDKSGRSQNNIPKGPSILQGTHYKNKLRHDVYHHADNRPNKVQYPEPNGLIWAESGEAYEISI